VLERLDIAGASSLNDEWGLSISYVAHRVSGRWVDLKGRGLQVGAFGDQLLDYVWLLGFD